MRLMSGRPRKGRRAAQGRRASRIIALAALAAFAAGGQAAWSGEAADPAYAWLNGKWTTGNIPWRQNLDLKVGDGNMVGGAYDITDPDSDVTYTGAVKGEVNGNRIVLTTMLKGYPEDFRIDLERVGAILEGTRSGKAKSWSLLLTKVAR